MKKLCRICLHSNIFQLILIYFYFINDWEREKNKLRNVTNVYIRRNHFLVLVFIAYWLHVLSVITILQNPICILILTEIEKFVSNTLYLNSLFYLIDICSRYHANAEWGRFEWENVFFVLFKHIWFNLLFSYRVWVPWSIQCWFIIIIE